jgi:tetratricopeptide (TPR) repeat protein
MKKLFLALLAFALFTGTSIAQTPAADLIKAANKAVKSIGGKKDKFPAAEAAVDAMMKTPENQTNWEALLVKGKMYNEMSSIDNLQLTTAKLTGKPYKPEFTKSAMMAVDALIAASKATQDKKQLKDVVSALTEAQGNLGNYVQEFTDAKDYVSAYNCLNAGLTSHEVLKSLGAKSIFDKVEEYNKQLYLVGLLSVYADKEKESVAVYEKMIAAKKDTSFVYSSLYKVKAESDPEAALKYLEMGRQKFPDDAQLLFTEINHYLKAGKLEVLTDKLKAGIAKEPKNVSLYFTLGNVYDNLSQKETDPAKAEAYAAEAMTYYKKTLELDAKNSDAIYSIGASFYNKAALYSKEMKKLESDFSKPGQKKYEEAEKMMIGEFDKALPYFKKAESINPNDQNTLIALKEIYAKKNDMQLSKEFKSRLETVQGGGKNAKSYFTE